MDNEIQSEDQQEDNFDELPAPVRVAKDEKELRKRWDDLVTRIHSSNGPSPQPEES